MAGAATLSRPGRRANKTFVRGRGHMHQRPIPVPAALAELLGRERPTPGRSNGCLTSQEEPHVLHDRRAATPPREPRSGDDWCVAARARGTPGRASRRHSARRAVRQVAPGLVAWLRRCRRRVRGCRRGPGVARLQHCQGARNFLALRRRLRVRVARHEAAVRGRRRIGPASTCTASPRASSIPRAACGRTSRGGRVRQGASAQRGLLRHSAGRSRGRPQPDGIRPTASA